MEITRSAGGIVLGKLDVFLVELLRQIPVSADPGGSEAGRQRLYSNPARDAQANDEWREYVEPELRHLFETSNETVRRDLQQFKETDDGGVREYSLRIPAEHFEIWLNSMNQARLVLAARHEFTDEELAAEQMPALESTRDLGLFQIHFYGFLQEFLVREIDPLA